MLTAYNQGRFLIPANSLFDHEQGWLDWDQKAVKGDITPHPAVPW